MYRLEYTKGKGFIDKMSPCVRKSSSSKKKKTTPKTKTYVALNQPTLLKSKPLAKQGKVIRSDKSGSVVAAHVAMAVYKRRYKQLSSVFLYRRGKGTVSRYSINFKSKSGKKVASAKLTSKSICKVTPGKPGKSRACHAAASGTKCTTSHGHKSLKAKTKSLSKSKSDLKKAKKVLTSTKKRVTKAKKVLCKSKSGSKTRTSAKKKVAKLAKEMASKKKRVTKLKAAVKKKTKSLSSAHKSLHKK